MYCFFFRTFDDGRATHRSPATEQRISGGEVRARDRPKDIGAAEAVSGLGEASVGGTTCRRTRLTRSWMRT